MASKAPAVAPTATSTATSPSLDIKPSKRARSSSRSKNRNKKLSPLTPSTTVLVAEDKYKHLFPIHAQLRPSTLSHDAHSTPSFIGFRNLMVLVLSTAAPPSRPPAPLHSC